MNLFQKLLDQNAANVTGVEDKKKIDHSQNLIIYYNTELILALRKKLRDHERRLADMLKTKNELQIGYFKEHDAIMQDLESFNISFTEYKGEFFEFIETVI